MIASILILVFSLILFAYWFRYTCLLVLQTQTSKDYVKQVVEANRLSFVSVRKALDEGTHADLDPLHRALESDYRVITFLLDHAANLNAGSIEQRLLLLDYKVMQVWYRLTRNASAAQAQRALAEMSGILGYFANSMGAQFLAQSNRA